MAHRVPTTMPRFTVQRDDDYYVWSVDVLDTGRLAVAGYSSKRENSFIDLFMFNSDPDSQEKPLSLTSEPYFSEEFTEFGSSLRSVCFLDDCRFLTCCKDTIALYDSGSNGGLVNQGKFNGEAGCMTTRDGLVYVGLGSEKVIVLSEEGREVETECIISKTITLKGLEGSPYDLTVSSNNKLFICTRYNGGAYICNSEGEKEHKYTNTLEHSYAWSITVSEEKGLIFILWRCGVSGEVVVYSLPGGHSSIFGGHSSISGGHILATLEVPDNSMRIRINNNINRLFVVTDKTGEVYEYHTSDIFTFDNLLKVVKLLTEKDHCRELIDYLGVPCEESMDISSSDAPFSSLFRYLRKEEKVPGDEVSHLMTACSDKELRKWRAVYQLTQLTLDVFKDQREALENERQELSDKLTESENGKQQLRDELKALKDEKEALLQQQKQASPTKPHPPWRISLAYDQSTFQYLSDIFTFDTLLKFVEPLTEKDHCRELIDYFDVPAEESKVIIESDAPFCSLFRYLREEGMVSVDAFSRLMIACSDKGLRKSRAVEQLTQLTLDVFKDQREALEKRTQELTDKLMESEKEKQQLRDELKDKKKELLQQQQQASSSSDAEGETLLEEHETLDRS